MAARNQGEGKSERERLEYDPDIQRGVQLLTDALMRKYGSSRIQKKVLERKIFPWIRCSWREKQDRLDLSTTDQLEAGKRIHEELSKLHESIESFKGVSSSSAPNGQRSLQEFFDSEVEKFQEKISRHETDHGRPKLVAFESAVKEMQTDIQKLTSRERKITIHETFFGKDPEETAALQQRIERAFESMPAKYTPNARLQSALADQSFVDKLKKAFANHSKIFDAQIVDPQRHDLEIFCGCKMEVDKSEHTVELSHDGITWTARLCHTKLQLTDPCESCSQAGENNGHEQFLQGGSTLYCGSRGITCGIVLHENAGLTVKHVLRHNPNQKILGTQINANNLIHLQQHDKADAMMFQFDGGVECLEKSIKWFDHHQRAVCMKVYMSDTPHVYAVVRDICDASSRPFTGSELLSLVRDSLNKWMTQYHGIDAVVTDNASNMRLMKEYLEEETGDIGTSSNSSATSEPAKRRRSSRQKRQTKTRLGDTTMEERVIRTIL